MSYKENQSDIKERVEYSKQYTLGIIFIVSAISLILSLIITDSLSKSFFSIGDWKWNIFVLSTSISFYIYYKIKAKELDNFFFKPVEVYDGVKYPEEIKFLKNKKKDVLSIFDFDAETLEYDPEGTNRIAKLFRDDILETIRQKSPKKEKSYLEKYKNSATPSQIDKLFDLFMVIEGTLQEYKMHKKTIQSPIYLDRKNKNIVLRDTTVFKGQEKLYFSYKMIDDTLKAFTYLFAQYVKKQILIKNTRLSKKYPNIINEKNYIKTLDIFKLMFFRRLMKNYGSMPSGWFVIRLEDYDARAIVSAIDRDMIPLITSQNDGSSKAFNSDVYASAFLTLYWSFIKSNQIRKIVEHVDWAFNTTKDINDIKMYEFIKSLKENS